MWKLIEQLNWDDTRNSNKIKQQLLRMGRETSDKGEAFVYARFKQLAARVAEYENENQRLTGFSGDDSFSDLLYHAISMGEEYFNNAMADPSILNDLDYQESFIYCFPYPDDWEVVDAIAADVYYQKQGQRMLDLIDTLDDLEWEVMPIVSEIIRRANALVEGDLKTAFEQLAPRKNEKNFNKTKYNHLYEWEGNQHGAIFSNLLFDAYAWSKM